MKNNGRSLAVLFVVFVAAAISSAYLFTHDIDVDFGVRSKLKTEQWKPRQVAVVMVPRKYTEAKPPNARGSLAVWADSSMWYREDDEFAIFDDDPVFTVPDRYLAPMATADGVIEYVKRRAK